MIFLIGKAKNSELLLFKKNKVYGLSRMLSPIFFRSQKKTVYNSFKVGNLGLNCWLRGFLAHSINGLLPIKCSGG